MWFAGLSCLVLRFGCGFGLRLGGVLCLGWFWGFGFPGYFSFLWGWYNISFGLSGFRVGLQWYAGVSWFGRGVGGAGVLVDVGCGVFVWLVWVACGWVWAC